jgi:hypothetical protein
MPERKREISDGDQSESSETKRRKVDRESQSIAKSHPVDKAREPSGTSSQSCGGVPGSPMPEPSIEDYTIG